MAYNPDVTINILIENPLQLYLQKDYFKLCRRPLHWVAGKGKLDCESEKHKAELIRVLLKGGIPAAPSGTATLLRLSPSY